MKHTFFTMLLLLSVLLVSSVSAQSTIDSILFTSEEWENYTNADGTGLYWDIFRAVYEPRGIVVTIKILPYIRSVKMVREQKADAVVGTYLDEFDKALFPQRHFDYEVVSALFKKGTLENWKGEASLEGMKLGWIRGYGYDEYLASVHDFVEVDSRRSALRMLQAGHLDIFLDAADDIQTELNKGTIPAEMFQMETLLTQNLYPAFAENERGEELLRIFDKRMSELIQSGELRPLFAQWDSEYPFEKAQQ